MNRVALIICGALGREIKTLVEAEGWEVDLYGVPAMHHFRPALIVAAVERRLHEIRGRYGRVIVAYGDCGTTGLLEPVLQRYGAVRLDGPHCYEMFAGAREFARLSAEQPGTFFLTDWLVRNFDRAVTRGLGIDRFPELQAVYFGNYTDLVYLAQFPTDRLVTRAREIAAALRLPLEVRHVGLGELASRLRALIEAPAAQATAAG